MSEAEFVALPFPHWLKRNAYLTWLLPLIVYMAMVIPAIWTRRYHVNPDGICYIRLATYLAQGDWRHSFSGYWSPLFPWCMAPLIAIGVTGLMAAHIVLGLTGAAVVLLGHRLLVRLNVVPQIGVLCIMMFTAVMTVGLAVKFVTPDLMMAALLLGYLALMAREDIDQPRVAVWAGCIGALAYFAKAYALPFIIVHFPLTLLLRWCMGRRADEGFRPMLKACGKSLAAGFGALVVLCAPWVAVLSISYGHFTTGTAGPINHNQVVHAPPEFGRPQEVFVPPDPYIIENEIYDRYIIKFWSPFDTPEHRQAQWQIFKANVPQIVDALRNFGGSKRDDSEGDVAGNRWYRCLAGVVPILLSIGVLLSLAALAMRRWRIGWQLPWLVMTVLLFCAGFTVVHFEPRLIETPLRFVVLLICFLVLLELARLLPWRQLRTPASWILPAILLIVLAYSLRYEVRLAYRRPPLRTLRMREVALLMRQAGLRGVMACSDRGDGMYVGFFSGNKVVSIPGSADAAAWARACEDNHVRSMVIYSEFPPGGKGRDRRGCAQMIEQGNWKLRFSLPKKESDWQADVYEFTPSATIMPTTQTASPDR